MFISPIKNLFWNSHSKACRRAIFNQFQPETKPCAKICQGHMTTNWIEGSGHGTRGLRIAKLTLSQDSIALHLLWKCWSQSSTSKTATRQVIPNLIPILSQYSMYTITKSENKRKTGPCHPIEFNILFCQLP